MEQRTLPAGTILHLQGIPVQVVNSATVEAQAGNWKLIDEFAAAPDARDLSEVKGSGEDDADCARF